MRQLNFVVSGRKFTKSFRQRIIVLIVTYYRYFSLFHKVV